MIQTLRCVCDHQEQILLLLGQCSASRTASRWESPRCTPRNARRSPSHEHVIFILLVQVLSMILAEGSRRREIGLLGAGLGVSARPKTAIPFPEPRDVRPRPTPKPTQVGRERTMMCSLELLLKMNWCESPDSPKEKKINVQILGGSFGSSAWAPPLGATPKCLGVWRPKGPSQGGHPTTPQPPEPD